ncbi:MAG: MBL fold metallo-hydrolase [Polyangiaceae bacterium]
MSLYLRQLLVGRDIGRGNPAGAQMQNFVYLVGDREKGECMVVDPAWDIPGILDVAREDGMKVTGALVTHYHPDHVGGLMFGLTVEAASRRSWRSIRAKCTCTSSRPTVFAR